MRVMIVDDERPCLDKMEYLLRKNPDVLITGVFINPLEALAAVELSMPDAVFLDVVMLGMSGIELAERIHRLDETVQVVFVTAHVRLLAGANKAWRFECLLKPASEKKLNTIMESLTVARANRKLI